MPLLRFLAEKGELTIWYREEPWIEPLIELFNLKCSIFKGNEVKNQEHEFDLVFLPFDSSPVEFEKILKKVRADKVIQHIPPRKGKRYYLNRILTRRQWIRILNGRHETELNLDLAREIFGSIPMPSPHPTLISRKIDTLFYNSYIVIQPGAANGLMQAKTWPPEHFSDLIYKFNALYPNYQIYLVGDSGDEKSLKHFLKRWETLPIQNLLGKTDFTMLSSILKHARLVISHDSGIMHLANSLNVPLLALYGPTDEERTGPIGEKSHLIFSKHETRRAMGGFKTTERELSLKYPDNACMRDLLPDTVLTKIEDLLKRYNEQSSRL